MKLNQYAHLISFSLVMQIKHSKPLESDMNCFHISVHTYYHIRPLGLDDTEDGRWGGGAKGGGVEGVFKDVRTGE